MGIAETSRLIYLAIRCDPEKIAQLRAEFTELAMSIATDPDAAFELTSSTVNGQTFSGSRTITARERLEMLELVTKQLEAGRPLNLRTRAVF